MPDSVADGAVSGVAEIDRGITVTRQDHRTLGVAAVCASCCGGVAGGQGGWIDPHLVRSGGQACKEIGAVRDRACINLCSPEEEVGDNTVEPRFSALANSVGIQVIPHFIAD